MNGRIRQIKPEYWTSLSIGCLTRDARLLFIGLWNHADDEGRAVDDPRLIKAAVFPLDDDLGAQEVEQLLTELAEHRRIVRYRVDGRAYLEIANFAEHQYVQKRRESRLPCSDGADVLVPEEDGTPTVGLPEDYRLGQGLGSGVGVRCKGQGSGVALVAEAPAPRRRPPDLLWDAVMSACGITDPPTDSARGAYNRAVKDLRGAGAEPDEVRKRAAAFRDRWPEASLTPTALARRWPECNGQHQRTRLLPKSAGSVVTAYLRAKDAEGTPARLALGGGA